jgi:hypothetical protein
VLRRIFGPKRDEVTGGWRKRHNEELHDLYTSPSIIGIIKSRRMRWVGLVVRMWEKRTEYRLLVGKPEGKIPLGRPGHRWVDNIKMNCVETGWGGVDWICLVQDTYSWRACESGNGPSGSIRCWETASDCTTCGLALGPTELVNHHYHSHRLHHPHNSVYIKTSDFISEGNKTKIDRRTGALSVRGL